MIHQAVTRGLDPDVQTKPGEIPWLENIPKHWDVRRLGQLATKFGSGVTPRGGAAVYRDTGVPFLRSQNVHFDGLRLDDVVRIPPNLHESMSASHVQPHDVLLNITGASIGRVCSVPHDLGQGNVNQHVCIIRPNQELLLSRFLVAFLSTSGAQNDIRTEQTGASREGLRSNQSATSAPRYLPSPSRHKSSIGLTKRHMTSTAPSLPPVAKSTSRTSTAPASLRTS